MFRTFTQTSFPLKKLPKLPLEGEYMRKLFYFASAPSIVLSTSVMVSTNTWEKTQTIRDGNIQRGGSLGQELGGLQYLCLPLHLGERLDFILLNGDNEDQLLLNQLVSTCPCAVKPACWVLCCVEGKGSIYCKSQTRNPGSQCLKSLNLTLSFALFLLKLLCVSDRAFVTIR